jgi:hypothetical protein
LYKFSCNEESINTCIRFSPYVSVGGLRPYSWFQYFHEFGVYPIVITRQWSNEHRNFLDYIAPSESEEVEVGEFAHGTIIRTPYTQNISNKMLEKYGKINMHLLEKYLLHTMK